MTLKEFNIAHTKWCARIGLKACGRDGRNLSATRCKECVFDYLDMQTKFERLASVSSDDKITGGSSVSNTALAAGLSEMMTNIKSGNAPYMYPIGSRGVFGSVIFEVIGHNCQNGVEFDENDTLKVVAPKTMTLRLYTQDYYESSFCAASNDSAWNKSDLYTYLNETFYPTIPAALRDVIRTVENTTYTLDETQSGLTNKLLTYDKIWLPSASQLGITGTDIANEGSALPAFDSTISTDAKAKRSIVEYRGDQIIPKPYWTRSLAMVDDAGIDTPVARGVAITAGGEKTTLNLKTVACMVVPYIVIGPKES